MCVGLTPAATYAQMHRVLAFIGAQELDVTSRAAWSLTHDMGLFQDLQALVKFMAEHSQQQEQAATGRPGRM